MKESVRTYKKIIYFLFLVFVLFSAQGCIRPYPGNLPDVLEIMTQTAPVPGSTQSPVTSDLESSSKKSNQPGAGSTPDTGNDTARNPGMSPLYAVILVSEDNALNVRAAAGTDSEILEMLPANSRDLRVTGEEQQVGGESWVEIQRLSGESGWVSAAYLTQQVSPDAFCSDSKVKQVVNLFVQAVSQADGESIAKLVSPAHGLTVRQAWWNTEVNFNIESVSSLFEDETVHNWGITAGGGEPIEGSFRQAILPGLLDVVSGEFKPVCNSLDINLASGPTAGEVIWPVEYSNVNYMALYRAGAQTDQLNWRTWALGIEIIEGQPYLAFLVQYRWEP